MDFCNNRSNFFQHNLDVAFLFFMSRPLIKICEDSNLVLDSYYVTSNDLSGPIDIRSVKNNVTNETYALLLLFDIINIEGTKKIIYIGISDKFIKIKNSQLTNYSDDNVILSKYADRVNALNIFFK